MGCVARFEQQPEKYSKSSDPISGVVVDKADAHLYERDGRIFYFASLENLVRFDEDPRSHLSLPRSGAEPMAMP